MKKERDWTNSPGFLMYKDDETIFKMLPPKDCKAVLLAVFAYARGVETEMEGIQEIGFDHIKKHMDQNKDAYNEMVEKRKEAAQARWQREHEAHEEEPMQTDANDMQNDANECTCITLHEKTMQNDAQAMQTDAKHADIDIDYDIDNDIDNDNDIYIKAKVSSKLDASASAISEIVTYLNQQSGKSFRSSTKSTRRCIQARLKEGFTVDDFKTVIDNKVIEWGNDNHMEQYLRPETLFGTKFESYLNQQYSGKKLTKSEEMALKIQSGYYDDGGKTNDQTGDSSGSDDFDWGFFSAPSG